MNKVHPMCLQSKNRPDGDIKWGRVLKLQLLMMKKQ